MMCNKMIMSSRTAESRITLFILIVIIGFSSIAWNSNDDIKLHREGKKWVRQREWQKAIDSYNEILNKYPGSLYCDDAQFWIGFSWEQIPGGEQKAFQFFQKVVDNYSHSPWVDDAVIHQIFLAKKMIQSGNEKPGEFLTKKVSDSDSTIRYQAALALGELRDPHVLPLLEEMATGEDQVLARRAMDLLKGYSNLMDGVFQRETAKPGVSFDRYRPSQGETSRIIYENLKREGSSWTETELLNNGLFHIVQKEDLSCYLSLENEGDRKEWLHKVWAPKDPTPTTEKNEAQEEFRRRVLYARKHFGKDWNFKENYYPPWDSRGEVYIKFGKPDRRDRVEMDWEEWTFHKHRIVLMVSDHLDNRMGDGIHFGKVSKYLYRRNIAMQRSQYIHEPQFLYISPMQDMVKTIKGMEFRIVSAQKAGSMIRVQFTYRFQAQNLKISRDNGRYRGTYLYRWVIYDEDYHPMKQYQTVEEVDFSEDESLNKSFVTGNIETTLASGSYILALRIEDMHSNRLGIYRKHFSTQSKNGSETLSPGKETGGDNGTLE